MKRTAKLTVETHRVLIIRGRQISRQLLCETCGEVVHFVTASEAAALAGTGQRTIYRLVEAGKLHFIETNEAVLLICFNSLGNCLLRTESQRVRELEGERRKP